MRFLSGLLLCLSPLWVVAAEQPVAIALHGGAGTIERDRMSVEVEAEYRSFLDEAISCLLYTSPSPRDRTRSRMPSSA